MKKVFEGPEPFIATILPTRKCNLNCSYCRIRKQDFPNELNWKEWVSCLKLLYKQFDTMGFSVLLGGDVMTWGNDLVKFAEEMEKTGLPYAVNTNGVGLTDEVLLKLKHAGISTSLDTLNERGDKSETIKSQTTKQLIPRMNALGFKDLHCTITVDSTNLEEVPEIVRFLTDHNTWAEINGMVYGKNPAYDFCGSKEDLKDRLFVEGDQIRIDRTMNKLVRMKEDGCLIHNTDHFLLNWSKYGIHQQWKCGHPMGLAIDADGSMRLCLLIKGSRVPKHNVKNLNYKKFLDDWYKDYNDFCEGCYWDCQYEPEYIYRKTKCVKAVEKYYNHGVKEVEKQIKEKSCQ
ncbi:MAG: radical SAM protein [Candidatus Heimdallarchaeaceae archaeon]